MKAKRSAIGFVDYGPGLSAVQGCTPASPGCAECWAGNILDRVGTGRDVTLRQDVLKKIPRMEFDRADILRPGENPIAFIASLGDLFHEDVPTSYIDAVIEALRARPDVDWYISTKRHQRAHDYFRSLQFEHLDNVWLAFSVSKQSEFDAALPLLVDIPQISQPVLCLEPLLERIDVSKMLDTFWWPWVIAGGMTGPRYWAYPWEDDWAREIYQACQAGDWPFWFKQGTSRHPDRGTLDGAVVHQIPSKLVPGFRTANDHPIRRTA